MYATIDDLSAELPRQEFRDGEDFTSPTRSEVAGVLARVQAEVDLLLEGAGLDVVTVRADGRAGPALKGAAVDLAAARVRHLLSPTEVGEPAADAVAARLEGIIGALQESGVGGGAAGGASSSRAFPPVMTMRGSW